MASISILVGVWADMSTNADDLLERVSQHYAIEEPDADEERHLALVSQAVQEVELEWRLRRQWREENCRVLMRMGWECDSPEPNMAILTDPLQLNPHRHVDRPNPRSVY